MGSEKAQERKIVFFCSASFDIDEKYKYNQAAREATRAACSLGYTVVSGGTVKGTMGVVADEVVRCGGRHVGIIPRFMEDVVYPSLDETVWTDTMAERKELMREGTCVAVALPGGIGTLDELIEAGLEGLRKGAMKYNLDADFKFISYAVWWIRQGIIQAIEVNKNNE